MSDAKVRGIVHVIEPTKTYGQKGFRKRLVVLEQDNGRFQNFIPIEFVQDGCDQVDDLQVGDDVEIAYRLSGRRWQKDSSSEVKYFLNLEASSFNKLGGSSAAAGSKASANDAFDAAADDADVPF